jgi:bacterioferritin-associated ferredoxin
MPICSNKNCPLSGQDQPDSHFHKEPRKINGLRSVCRECNRRARRKYCKDHPDKVIEYAKLWKIKNPEKHRAQLKRYREAHKEEFNKAVTAWHIKKIIEQDIKKISEIKMQGCICPGCGFNYSDCPDKALVIVFEKSHVHSTKCTLRKRKTNNRYNDEDEFFWSCQPCNGGKQGSRCGYWLAPNKFNPTCQEL